MGLIMVGMILMGLEKKNIFQFIIYHGTNYGRNDYRRTCKKIKKFQFPFHIFPV
jgi:hypothetical protein